MPLYLKQKREKRAIEPALTELEVAKRTVAGSSGIHFNFGSNIAARREYYDGIERAKALLVANGYTLRENFLGLEVVDPEGRLTP